MNKQAYMIMAHNQFSILQKLVDQIDNEKNDIYIHVDAKVKVDCNNLLENKKYKSKIKFVKRYNVYWGDYSQIEAELSLFKEATKTYHSYYHLLSGVDLLIKPVEEIYSFFENSNKKEFIKYTKKGKEMEAIDYRYKYYWIFMKKRNNKFFRILSSGFVKVQKLLNFERRNDDIEFAKGANWISVTHDCLNYVLSKQNFIKDRFKNTLCCDEVFFQTIVFNSAYFKNVVNNNYRFVLWNSEDDNSPKTLGLDNYDQIVNSNCMFARKFDIKENGLIHRVINIK